MNMKIYISYFYQLRFFPQNLIPISTATFDPKWFHDFNGSKYVFADKRGVINGLRAPAFNLPYEIQEELENKKVACQKNCLQTPPNCAFMNAYRDYLNTLDFDNIMERIVKLANKAKETFGIKDDIDVVLMVHEATYVPCSERPILKEWFENHGVEITEWKK